MFALAALAGCVHSEGAAKTESPAAQQTLAATPAAAPPATHPPATLKPAVTEPPLAPPPAAVPALVGSPAAPAAAASPVRRGPAIYAAKISPGIVHNGEPMTWAVRTTNDVVSVTVHVSLYTLPLHRDRPGHFALSFTVPSNVPGMFHGTYQLNIVAADAAGETARLTLPLVFQ